MQLSGVRPSVCPSVRPCHPAATRLYCGFAAVGPAARRYRSIAAAACGGRMWAVPHCQRTQQLNTDSLNEKKQTQGEAG